MIFCWSKMKPPVNKGKKLKSLLAWDEIQFQDLYNKVR